MKNRKIYGGYGPFDNQRKKRTGDAFDANPSPRATPPKPQSKPSFQEVMYPKANMPAPPLSAAPPINPAKPKAESKLSFQESLYPKASMPARPRPAAPLPKPTRPKPGPKRSFQESLYPKANMPAQALPVVQPPKPTKLEPGSKLSFQESLYPKQEPVTQSVQLAGTVTNKRSRGKNVAALGEEAKAAFGKERDAARNAAEARGERFDDVEFYKTHGEPMIERAKAAQAIKEAGEERNWNKKMEPLLRNVQKEVDQFEQNDPNAGSRLWNSYKIGEYEVGQAFHTSGLMGSIDRLAILDQLDGEKTIAELVADNRNIMNDEQIMAYGNGDSRTPWIRELIEERAQDHLGSLVSSLVKQAQIPRHPAMEAMENAGSFAEAWEFFLTDWAEIIGHGIAENLAPSAAAAASNLLAGPAGTFVSSSFLTYGNKLIEYLGEEKGVDLQNEDSIYQALSDPAIRERVRGKAGRAGLSAGLFDAVTGLMGVKLLSKRGVAGEVADKFLSTLVSGAKGAGSEAAQQAAAEGEVSKPGRVLLDGVASAVKTGVGKALDQ